MKILVAASTGINEFRIHGALRQLASDPANEFLVGAGNAALSKTLPGAEVIAIKSRGEIKRALESVDALLLLWDGVSLNDLLFEAKIAGIRTRLVPCRVTRVVNKNLNHDFDIYIGRGSPWGNPFPIVSSGPDRAEVIERYRTYFKQRLRDDSGFRLGVRGLRGMRLACHCKPDACHGDVIADYLDGPESIADEMADDLNAKLDS